MTISIKIGGTWKDATPYIKVGGTWKPVQEIWTKVSGAWKQVYSAFSISVSPTSIVNTAGTSAIVTGGPAVVTISGGSGSYAVLWSRLSGDAISVDSPNSLSTTFRISGLLIGDIAEADFSCTVTDNISGASMTTQSVTVTLGRIS